MDLNDYFDPVSIQKPQVTNVHPRDDFGKKLFIHTPDLPISDLHRFDIAILGVPEDRNSQNKGASTAPDKIRQKLYSLSKIRNKLNITDLGNMKPGITPDDTYYGLRDIILSLLDYGVIPVILGGTQDITYSCHQALLKFRKSSRLVTVDARLDLGKGKKGLTSDTWLEKIIKSKASGISFTNLGHQEYMVSLKDLEKIKRHGFNSYRLGRIRSDIKYFEPFFRDASIHSFDISAVRQSDAPGTLNSSPNGFDGTEICQLSRFSGLSDHVSVFLLTEVNPLLDSRDQTAHLAAQMVWYFSDGLSQRKIENPSNQTEHYTQYIVNLINTDYKLTFVKSEQTDRWWFKTPEDKHTSDEDAWIACSYEDYQMASNQEIPERWLDFFKK